MSDIGFWGAPKDSAATQAAADAAASAAAAQAAAAAAATRVSTIEGAPYVRGVRGKATIQAAIGIAAVVPITITYDAALPTGTPLTYSAIVTFEGTDTGILGNLSAMVAGGASKTLTGCTVNVKNSALVSLGLNVIVHVLALY